MREGHVKLFRKFRKSAFYSDSQYVHLWVHLLMSVNWIEKRLKLHNSHKYIDLHPGQVLTSRDVLSKETGINTSKVERILKSLENEQQIEQQTFSKYRVISIVNWDIYQTTEQQIEQQVNSRRTASEQQVNTKKNLKEVKELKEITKDLPSDSLRLSGMLANFILQNFPNNLTAKKQDAVKRWADEIDKMNRIDGRTWNEIEAMIAWCQRDNFWKGNILSGAKLREKFDQLSAKKSTSPQFETETDITKPDPLSAQRRAILDKYEYRLSH